MASKRIAARILLENLIKDLVDNNPVGLSLMIGCLLNGAEDMKADLAANPQKYEHSIFHPTVLADYADRVKKELETE